MFLKKLRPLLCENFLSGSFPELESDKTSLQPSLKFGLVCNSIESGKMVDADGALMQKVYKKRS